MCVWCVAVAVAAVASVKAQAPVRVTEYRLEKASSGIVALRATFSEQQLGVLEKLNRADLDHLPRLHTLVVPASWNENELAYAILPYEYPASEPHAKLLVVHVPTQTFGAYERGRLVRWGPISSGRRSAQTPPGVFFLNWKSPGHTSTIDRDWFMEWYFNFDNHAGLALHHYVLPGYPASHGCIRLLEQDAQWLFEWGDEWLLDARGVGVLERGTPVFVVGTYDFTAPPPWRALAVPHTVSLPPLPSTLHSANGS